MSTHRATTSVNSQFVRAHIVPLSKLPEPGVEFENTDVPNGIDLRALIQHSLITAVDTKLRYYKRGETDHYRPVKVWTTTEQGYKRIQRYLDTEYSHRLPCSDDAPHTGIRNLGDDKYECKDCETIHDRETVERVLGGGT